MDQPPPGSLIMHQLPFPAHSQPALPAHPSDLDHQSAGTTDLPPSQPSSIHGGMNLLLDLQRGVPDPPPHTSDHSLGESVQPFASEVSSRTSGYQFGSLSSTSEFPRPSTISQQPTDPPDRQQYLPQSHSVGGYSQQSYGLNPNTGYETAFDNPRLPANDYVDNNSSPKSSFDFSFGLENSFGAKTHFRLPEPTAVSLPATAASNELPHQLEQSNLHPQISPSRETTENTKPLHVSNVSNKSLKENASELVEVDSAAEMYADSGQAIVFEPSVQKCLLWNSDKSKSYNIELKPAVDRGFFLADDDWTCYRRNYFQISSIFTISETKSSSNEAPVVADLNSILTGPYYIEVNNRLMPVNCFLTHVTAHTTTFPPSQVLTSEPVELVQHMAKRNKAPLTQPVPRFSEPGSSVVFDRLQFRTATNNTTRKKANAGSIISQQFFSVAVEILAKLETGEFYRVCESKMEKGVVVRGRAPVHFQHDPPIEHPTTKRAAAIRAAKKVEENVAALRAPSPILEEEELKRPAPPVMPGSAMNLSVPMQKFSQGRQPYGMYSQQIQQAYGQGIPFQAQQNLYMQYPQQSPLQQYTGAQSQQSHQQQSGPYPSYTQYPFLGSQQSFPLSGASIGSQSMGYGMMSQSAQPAQNSYYNSSGIHSLLQPLPHSLPQPRSDQAHYAQAMPQSSSARTHMQQQQSGMYGQSMASSSFAQPYQNQSHQLFQHSTGDGQPQPQQQQPMYSTNNFFQPSATPQQSYSSYLSSTPQSIEGSGTQATQQLYHQTSNTVSGIESTPAYNGSVSVSGLDKPEMRNGGGNVYGGYSTETQQQIKRPVRDEAEESDDEYFGEGEDEDDEYAPRAKKR